MAVTVKAMLLAKGRGVNLGEGMGKRFDYTIDHLDNKINRTIQRLDRSNILDQRLVGMHPAASLCRR